MRARFVLSLGLALCGQLLLGGVLHAQPANITIGIVQPTAGLVVGDDLGIIAATSSTFEVRKVVAQVEGREVTLVFTSTAYYDKWGEPYPGWTNTLSLAGLTRGTKVVIVTATDVFNNSAQSQQAFVYDRKPVLTVTAPLDQTVARPQLRVAASCVDDDPAGCTIQVSVGGKVLAAGHDRVDQGISLSAYEGGWITVRFVATDSAGQPVVAEIAVAVESSVRLSEAVSAAGPIWDVQPDRILCYRSLGAAKGLVIRNRTNGLDTAIPGSEQSSHGLLTPKGAIFVVPTWWPSELVQVLEWRDGAIVELGDLGYSTPSYTLTVKGDFALWNCGETLVWRNLGTATNQKISSIAGNNRNDVADNGDAVYWTGARKYPPYDYHIFRYRGGTTTQLTSDTELWNVYPVTDGVNTVYQKSDPCCGTQRYGLFLNNGSTEIELAALQLRQARPSPGPDYQVSRGWVAFTRLGTGGQLQVWTRSPSGTEAQITFWGDSSRVSALAPNGEVMFWHGKRYLSRPAEVPIEITGLGNVFWQDGNWWITIGRSLFKVNTAAFPTISDLFTTTAGALGFQVGGAEAQQVIVQGSGDLSHWENLHTNTVSGGPFIFKDEAATALRQRFYRAVTP